MTFVLILLTKGHARLFTLLAASLVFCAWSRPFDAFALAVVATLAYYGTTFGAQAHGLASRATVIGIVLLPLLFFKYRGALPDGGDQVTTSAQSLLSGASVLPLGISFYTFQAVSYVVDVRRGRTLPAKTFWDLVLYLSFFPRLVAGPIERFGDLGKQLEVVPTPRFHDVYIGIKTVLWGYFCKLVIADKLAAIVAEVVQHQQRASWVSMWLALLLFSFQIYFDFYGYTNIAIGVARTFGVQLHQNFRDPYLARSIREFWRRWHITLMTWLRDYVYLPLGGKEQGTLGRYATIVLVFVLSGVWHGAAITFLLWALFHAVLYMGSVAGAGIRARLVRATGLDRLPNVHAVLQRLTCFACVSVGWVPFITPDLQEVVKILRTALPTLGRPSAGWLNPVFGRLDTYVFLWLLAVFFTLDSSGLIRRVLEWVPSRSRDVAIELGLVNAMVVSLFLFGGLGSRTFIYIGF